MWAILSTANHRATEGNWEGGTAGAVLGTVNLDLSQARPTPGARLRVIAILGTVNVHLPAGYPATVGGVSILGAFNGQRDAGAPAAVRVRCFNLMGTVNVSG
jgi:hypothetical protein